MPQKGLSGFFYRDDCVVAAMGGGIVDFYYRMGFLNFVSHPESAICELGGYINLLNDR